MACAAGPDVAEDGLVLALDGANFKSFKGEATTNLIPSPTINSYPTTGNAWGTFNTNQYNSAQYFSIGTIASVTSNVVTTSTNHPLRTYDVVRPQTTGGGVTAGTDYFVKKLSDTTFTLHAYNSSQDGSQGYISSSTGTHKVYDSIANDTRISVNATSFPTMWWGAPHLPNSGLVKEIRYSEFDAIPNLPPNDCIRLHYIRTDNVKDGMAYGVNCTVTAGSPVTVSFYTRAANANAVGKQIRYQTYNYTGGSATNYFYSFTLGQLGVWERQTFTFTPAYGGMISYWFPISTTGTYAWDWSCMQVEQKSYVTNFVAGTRGTTVATGGGWADLTGNENHGELVNGVRENADNLGSLVFDGTDDKVTINASSYTNLSSGNFTISSWFYIPTSVDTTNLYYWLIAIGTSAGSSNTWYLRVWRSGIAPGCLFTRINNVVLLGTDGNLDASYPGDYYKASGRWTYFAFVENSGTSYYYMNGVQTGSASTPSIPSGNNYITIGDMSTDQGVPNNRFSNFSLYNRALTASEIQQNYNATKSRFGL